MRLGVRLGIVADEGNLATILVADGAVALGAACRSRSTVSRWHGASSKAARPAGADARLADALLRRTVAITAEAPTRPPSTKERIRRSRCSSSGMSQA